MHNRPSKPPSSTATITQAVNNAAPSPSPQYSHPVHQIIAHHQPLAQLKVDADYARLPLADKIKDEIQRALRPQAHEEKYRQAVAYQILLQAAADFAESQRADAAPASPAPDAAPVSPIPDAVPISPAPYKTPTIDPTIFLYDPEDDHEPKEQTPSPKLP